MLLLLKLDRSFFQKLDQSFLSIVAKCLNMRLSLKLDRLIFHKLDQSKRSCRLEDLVPKGMSDVQHYGGRIDPNLNQNAHRRRG